MSDPCDKSVLGQTQLAPAPVTTNVDGVALTEKLRAVAVQGGALPTVVWVLTDPTGTSAIDLTSWPGGVTVALKVRDAFANFTDLTCSGAPSPGVEFTGEVLAPAAGQVGAVLDLALLPGPGVYDAEFAVLDATTGQVLFTNPFKLICDRTLWGQSQFVGPPTRAEIRLWLRDSSRAQNLLLDLNAWDDADIAAAITRPVDDWNEMLPPVAFHTTASFPYRSAWLGAITGYLHLMITEEQLRNHLPAAVGGIQVALHDKFDAHQKLGQDLVDRYKAWAQKRKIAINLGQGYAEDASGYGWRWPGLIW